ncbi:MAG: pyrroline-5-carboxylate reductase [Clostridia bacterium]|nr:pyrroline-5-carboxylate reductase [Clostridia bacterium]
MGNVTFGFIGCGNMGGALARAVRRSMPEARLLLCNRTPEKARALAEAVGGDACLRGNREAAAESDYLFLGVKPQMMAGVLEDLKPALEARKAPCVLVSMAAGLTVETLRRMAGVDFPIIRIMPNTPAAIGQGMVLCCVDGLDAGDPRMERFCRALAGAGALDFVEEKLIDAGSAVAGCGPAFAAMLIEALADGGVACGLPRAKAQRYAAQMLLGTAALALEGGEHPGAMKDAVCSPGGSTIQGVRALEARGFRSAAFEAVVAAYEKTLQMGKQ